MALETTVLLRTILFQLRTAQTLEDAIIALEAMCSKEDIAVVKEKVDELKARIAEREK